MSKISAKARKELVAAVAERYQTGTATEKGCILDEFTALTGYHRKHASASSVETHPSSRGGAVCMTRP